MAVDKFDGKTGPVPVVGITADDPSKPPCRLELRELAKNKDQWNLYLLAMERFMDKKNEADPLSYFQIAGIHGAPYNKWPNYEWKQENAVGKGGYCTHTSVLFLTWHRPYLALYEQQLYKHVNDIAESFPEADPLERKADYIKAAKNFRMPYWDWALQTNTEVTLFPKEVWATTKPEVIRPGSKGKPTTMKVNPLASYEFGDLGKDDSRVNRFSAAGINRTLRWPNSDDRKTATGSLEDKVQQRLETFKQGTDVSKGKNLSERVFWILTAYKNYGAMCTNLFAPDFNREEENGWSNWGSLEDIHNAVHSYVGRGGHMSSTATAAFDPVFWLHHTNIDRLYAIWQALNEKDDDAHSEFVQGIAGSHGTRVIVGGEDGADGGKQNSKTPLYPFNNKSGEIDKFWTSKATVDTKVFGHVYPETQKWVYTTRNAIRNRLVDLYSYASLSTIAKKPDAASKIVSRARMHAVAAQVSLPPPTLESAAPKAPKASEEISQKAASIKLPKDRKPQDLIIDNKYLEWLVDIKAEKHTNNGDFEVHVFLGDPQDEDPALYIFNQNHVASFNTLGQSPETGCEKCKSDQAVRTNVTGQIPLTLALVERYQAGLIDGLTPEIVEPYLAANLHWRVVTGISQLTPRDQINGLLVGVVTCEVTVPTEPNTLPQYAAGVVPRPNCTIKKQENWNGSVPEGRGDGTGYTGGDIQ